jgi:hypothetical protein
MDRRNFKLFYAYTMSKTGIFHEYMQFSIGISFVQ